MSKFYEKKEEFWEYNFVFGEDFLKSIYPDNFKRIFSLKGDGLFNLILLDNKIYNIDLKETKNMLINDNKKAFRDPTKDEIVLTIANGLNKLGLEYTINSGKFITFKIFDKIGKIEIVKKASMPE